MRISILSVTLVPVLACSVSVPPRPAPAKADAPGAAEASPSDAEPPRTDEGAPAVPTQPAPAPEGLRAKIDAIVEPEIDTSGANAKIVGAAVAILTPSVRTVLGYGVTGLGDETVPTASTIFEIGSNTKPITGLVLAQRIVNGATSLDAPVSALLPAGVDIPSYRGAPIRLVHLATHTSGLPDFPDNLIGKPPTPGAGYTDALLYDFLGAIRCPPRQAPPCRTRTSASGCSGSRSSRPRGRRATRRSSACASATASG